MNTSNIIKPAQVAKRVLDDINEIVNDGSFNSLTTEEQSQLLQEQRQATRANAQAQRNLQNAKTRLEDTQQHVNNIEQNKAKSPKPISSSFRGIGFNGFIFIGFTILIWFSTHQRWQKKTNLSTKIC